MKALTTGQGLLPLAVLTAAVLGGGLTAVAAPDGGWPAHRLTVHRYRPPIARAPIAAPLDIPLDGSGLFFRTPFSVVEVPGGPPALVRVPHYQGPDGSYDDLADLTNDIQGTPCGQECTDRSLARWGYIPAD